MDTWKLQLMLAVVLLAAATFTFYRGWRFRSFMLALACMIVALLGLAGMVCETQFI